MGVDDLGIMMPYNMYYMAASEKTSDAITIAMQYLKSIPSKI